MAEEEVLFKAISEQMKERIHYERVDKINKFQFGTDETLSDLDNPGSFVTDDSHEITDEDVSIFQPQVFGVHMVDKLPRGGNIDDATSKMLYEAAKNTNPLLAQKVRFLLDSEKTAIFWRGYLRAYDDSRDIQRTKQFMNQQNALIKITNQLKEALSEVRDSGRSLKESAEAVMDSANDFLNDISSHAIDLQSSVDDLKQIVQNASRPMSVQTIAPSGVAQHITAKLQTVITNDRIRGYIQSCLTSVNLPASFISLFQTTAKYPDDLNTLCRYLNQAGTLDDNHLATLAAP